MVQFVLLILYFITYTVIGFFTYLDGKKEKVPMHITPWTCRQSWMTYGVLMFSLLLNIIMLWEILTMEV